MAKVGLADTLKLLSAGYKKKDIDALAAIDEENTPDPEQKEEVSSKHENQEVKEEEKSASCGECEATVLLLLESFH